MVDSVASVFVSRWDAAVASKAPEPLRNRLGIAVAMRTYAAYRTLLASPRWQRLYNAGARPQRLLWASTGTKDPKASDILYIKGLAAPFTVNTMPEATLKALRSTPSSDRSCPPMAEIAKKCLRSSPRRESISMLWPLSFRMKAASRLSNPGTRLQERRHSENRASRVMA